MNPSLAFISGLLTLLSYTALSAEKSTYKWKAGDGSIQYGDQVPPKESKKTYDIYNSKGTKIRTISRAKSQEEHRIEDEKKRKLQILKKIAARKHKEDIRLLRLYPNEEAVLYARKERIDAIQNGIELSSDALTLYQGNISSLRKSAANHARARKPIPKNIKIKIANYRKMIEEIIISIKNGKTKQQKIRLTYEKILSRYQAIEK
ncbi:hypothetical protein MNBD_GAMMA12-1406 [hydrothermal vent metagenome]|uniref:DUF4124 domain-containing protein n=1 Tax=hydrothermal vent metagenome TaxID=652676 RepID=A0A3B0YQT0_9ZZZZ